MRCRLCNGITSSLTYGYCSSCDKKWGKNIHEVFNLRVTQERLIAWVLKNNPQISRSDLMSRLATDYEYTELDDE